jgi:DNA-binding response OmpR family regulator
MSDAISSKNDQVIVLIRADAELYENLTSICDFEGRQLLNFQTDVEMFSEWELKKFTPVAIISKSDILGKYGVNLIESLHKKKFPAVPVLLIAKHLDKNLRKIALGAGITDIFIRPVKCENIVTRVNFLINNWSDLQKKLKKKNISIYNTPIGKRAFDIFFSGAALFFLSPFFLLVYVLIKLESAGPAFYYSYRVGTGYRVFRFYKFR